METASELFIVWGSGISVLSCIVLRISIVRSRDILKPLEKDFVVIAGGCHKR